MNKKIEQKCSYIAILGAPNAGKSTLMNQLVGSKVSIVSPKVQTTRASVRGICTEGDSQLIFIDTPGIFSPKKTLEKAIVKEAWRSLADADINVLLMDARRGVCENTASIIESLKKQEKKAVLILNKVDLINPERLLPLAKEMDEIGIFSDIFMISALKNNGVDGVKQFFLKNAKPSPWMFPEDQIMEAPIKFFAAEITREKIFMRLQQEIPYSIAVETEKWEDKGKKGIDIHQVVYVLKEGQKRIIVGKNASMIKQIGIDSRKELEYILETKVNLFLFVKVKENWTSSPDVYREIGLELPKS